jgi:type IV pilus assembly protein PilM
MDILNTITKKLGGMFSSKSKDSVFGIDVGGSAIKVVQIRKKGGKAVLETYGSVALGPYGEEKKDVGQSIHLSKEALLKALIDVIRESNVTTTNAMMAIPASAALVFVIDLPPAVDERNLASVVPTEARRYVPVPISEVKLDWWPIPNVTLQSPEQSNTSTPPVKSEVLVAAVRNETITDFQTLGREAGLAMDSMEIEFFSSARAGIARDLRTVALLDIGASHTKLVIIEHGVVHDVHVINRGGQDITKALATSFSIPFSEAESIKRKLGITENALPEHKERIRESIDFIFSDVKNVMTQYEQKHNCTIDRIAISGGSALLPGLAEYMSTSFSYEIGFVDPFSNLEVPQFLTEVLKESGPEFAVAIGLAMRELGE